MLRQRIVGFVKSVALYLVVVIGGLTLFMILAPLVGYLPYSDRPGPGWYGSFPAVSWGEFWSNAVSMLGFGLFFAMLFVLAGVLSVLAIRALEHLVQSQFVVRGGGGILTAVITGYWMLGAGWYISAGLPVLIVAAALGAVAGAWCLPRKRRSVAQGA